MGFMTGLIVGIVLGWLLYPYVPPRIVKTLHEFATDWMQKLRGWLTSVVKSKKQTAILSGTSKTPISSPDDLKKIEGIGPKIAELLNAGGVLTYTDLAGTDVEILKGILDKAGSRYRVADPSTWPEQAVLASQGDWLGLKEFKQKLKGGRRVH